MTRSVPLGSVESKRITADARRLWFDDAQEGSGGDGRIGRGPACA
jgi:hypothetical protein